MVSGSERQSYITSLIQLVISAALAAGAYGTQAYTTAYNNGVANLLTQANALAVKIQNGGNSLQSITIPGQTSNWVVSMSLTEQLSAMLDAWNQLQGNQMIIRRTTARYFN